ncbi:PREDICTED: G-protein coupled receptor family C group 5 member C, partial [Fulmarus glacialis]|uniref:G-protein coupled receptor family C group 5 member C n=1 Tax=Fulmarus glacialis TaxID=30455 RepID=UPI00051AE1EE
AGGQTTPPSGCGKDLSPLYYNLCDLSAAWGIVLEAVASLGVVASFVLTIVLVASLPFVQDPQKKSLVATQVFFLLGTFGLFCLTFDFIVGPDFSTCTSRRFLFGVLFGICFSCLLAHAVALNFLVRRPGPSTRATPGLSMAIWVAWMVMYLYGNQRAGKKPSWDDPTLAIALVSNACTFLLLYVIPEVTHVTRRGSEQAFEDDVYPTRGVGYETILKEQKSQSMFVENKAFSMDEPSF